ncbi:MAG TPA: TAXI family TRAP transporter solute-binding subunit [Dissulfurispiraceae bacterium]|nr:TAXI family TRAP transporter solute-binding subunit [Dissulfurispiraceae bacterium]
MGLIHKISIARAQAVFTEFFGLGRTAAAIIVLLICIGMIFAVFWFFHSAPPDTLVMTSGPEGSIFRSNAEKYAKILARNGVKLKILTSEGSLENLKRLANPSFHVDIGFVQGGVDADVKTDKLVSLGSISYQPLLVFYRSETPVDLLSELSGKRIAIGHAGSGSRTLSLSLLEANGIEPGGKTVLMDLNATDATKDLIEDKVDAVFLMGDSASVQNIRTLMRTPGIHLLDFTQAEGYTRRIAYLSKLDLPKGSIDFGKDIPAHDVHLIGPTVELIARSNLHPALSDLLIEAAQEVHGGAGLLRHKDEFPAPVSYEFAISDDATRYYKSGKSFLYRYLPFWMASLVNRILVVIVPMIVVMVPAMKMVPAIYRWRISLGIYRWYRAMLTLEQELLVQVDPVKQKELLLRLDSIEQAVNNMKVPASFAEQFYILRGHIGFVRDRLKGRGI